MAALSFFANMLPLSFSLSLSHSFSSTRLMIVKWLPIDGSSGSVTVAAAYRYLPPVTFPINQPACTRCVCL